MLWGLPCLAPAQLCPAWPFLLPVSQEERLGYQEISEQQDPSPLDYRVQRIIDRKLRPRGASDLLMVSQRP